MLELIYNLENNTLKVFDEGELILDEHRHSKEIHHLLIKIVQFSNKYEKENTILHSKISTLEKQNAELSKRIKEVTSNNFNPNYKDWRNIQ